MKKLFHHGCLKEKGAVWLFLLLSFGWHKTAAQPVNPHVKVYPPRAFAGNYDSSPQIIGIIQGKSGNMYFANASGVLEFDGYYWRIIEGTGNKIVRGFAMDSAGVIYVGGNNDIGFLTPDSAGKLVFKSLLFMLKESERDFGYIFQTIASDDAVFFMSRAQLMRYKHNEMKVWKPKTKFIESYLVNNIYHVEQDDIGLMRFAGDILEVAVPETRGKLNASDVLGYFRSLCPCSKRTNPFIARDEKKNLFVFDGTENLVNISPAVTNFLKEQRGNLQTVIFTDGSIAIGTYSTGVVLVDKKGELLQLIDKEDGITENIVNALYADRDDGLWIGHDIGMSRVQLNTPLSFFDSRSGYTGIAVSMARYAGRLYISTTDGVFAEKISTEFGKPFRFERIQDITTQAYSLLEVNNTLLCATITGVYQIEGTHAIKVAEGIGLDLLASGCNDTAIFAMLADGIITLEYKEGAWRDGIRIEGVSDPIPKAITEECGILWAYNNAGKIYRLDFSSGNMSSPVIAEFDTSDGVPPTWIEPVNIYGAIYFGTTNGIYEFDEAEKKFRHTAHPLFGYFIERKQEAGPIRHDRNGNVWVVSRGKAGKLFADGMGVYHWDSTGTMGIPETAIWSIYFDNDGIVWLGAADFLVKYDTKVKRNISGHFPTYVRKVVGGDSLLFLGTAGVSIPQAVLQFKHNDIAFEYASPFYEGENRYSLKLDGYDADWSQWNTEAKIRYTNLRPGEYTFRIKSKNVYGLEGTEGTFSFRVLPPFYLTVWAFMGYSILFVLSVWGLVKYKSRQLIRAKKRLEEIIEQRTAELKIRNEELLKAKEFEEQFLANMSHEIRTPMNIVVGLTNLILKTEANPKNIQYLKAIRQSADNLLVIINDILDISKIQIGKLEIDATDFSVREVVEEIINIMQLAGNEKALKLKTQIHPDVPEFVVGDPVRLNQILLNLVSNAVKFTERGEIAITCGVIGKDNSSIRLEFSVQDTGIGIAAEKFDTIFDSFVQGGKEITRRFGGTGLGLSICRHLVEMQGGKISVKSEVGKGSVFSFDILYEISSQKAPAKEPEMTASAAEVLNTIYKILLVEDNIFNQVVAKDTLESIMPGAQIDVVKSGQEAIAFALSREYDLVLMDINLPDMDGYEATRRIRAELPSPKSEVAIIAVTANFAQQEKEKCILAGMNEYIAKPFFPDELAQKIITLAKDRKTKNGKLAV
ncbi:MAG TPA: ATP-binding protein [Chitinophagales bacterium]|nr:ATP-binding protein [Chitinophagales bacterium]